MQFLVFLLYYVYAHEVIMSFEEWHGIYGIHANQHSHKKTLEDRREAFVASVSTIKEHNAKGLSWRMGLNQFSDLTSDEFGELMGFQTCRKTMNRTQKTFDSRQQGRLPQMKNPKNAASVDWRSTSNPLGKIAVAEVKNQGQCGSCWSFSTSGGLEGAWVVGGNDLVSLSEQQMVSCDKTDSGCNGGLMDYAFEYIESAGGLTSEAIYPYVSGTGSVPACNSEEAGEPVATISSYHDVTANDISAFETALNIGPVSIAIEADQSAFQYYTDGVFTGTCGTSLDHGVLAAGYGYDSSSGHNYWIMKNSWGTSWGMEGYMLMDKDYDSTSGQCGLLMQASYPVAGTTPTPGPGPTPTPPSGDSYEDPGTDGSDGCADGETAIVDAYDVTGRMCMPTCSSEWTCPDAPTGWNNAACVLSFNSQIYCGFDCSDDSSICEGGTVCTDYYGIFKLCMYQ